MLRTRVTPAKYKNVLADLPDDSAALKAMVLELQSRLMNAEARAAEADYKVQDLLRRLYGPKSEKLSDAQRVLFGILNNHDLPLLPATVAKEALRESARAGKKPNRKGGGRDFSRFDHLPPDVWLINPPKEERVGLVWSREEVTEELDYRPSQFVRRITVRPVWTSPTRQQAPLVAALPPQVIPQAGVTAAFIANVVNAKFVDYLPLYRQETIDARRGVWVSRQARNRYETGAAALLKAIRQGLKAKVLGSDYVQVDETFTDLLDPERRGHAVPAYFWGYHAPLEKAIVIEFSKSRSGSILHDFFPVFWKGAAQTDGARMYPGAFKYRPNIVHYECLMHLRRKVKAAVEAHEAEALPLLKEITSLYRLETIADDLGLSPEQRGYFRHARAKPILRKLHRMFKTLDARDDLFGNVRKAVTYALKRWPGLVRYAKTGNGRILIDQNGIERCFRPSKINLRNHLFVGHPDHGWVHAVIYSVTGSCRLLGVNPEAYLNWVLPELAARRDEDPDQNPDNIDPTGLLPHDFLRLHQHRIAGELTHCES